ncbi:MAG: hypothetical protein ACFFD7_15560 [Candidatus Thorarchaeota archaeon]
MLKVVLILVFIILLLGMIAVNPGLAIGLFFLGMLVYMLIRSDNEGRETSRLR